MIVNSQYAALPIALQAEIAKAGGVSVAGKIVDPTPGAYLTAPVTATPDQGPSAMWLLAGLGAALVAVGGAMYLRRRRRGDAKILNFPAKAA